MNRSNDKSALPGEPLAFSSPVLNYLFEEFKYNVRTIYSQRFAGQDDKCFTKNNDNPDNYAKCLYAILRESEDLMRDIEFKTFYVQKKIQECIDSPTYQANAKEGEVYCSNEAQKYIEQVLKSLN